VNSNADKIPFHPYYSVKDLFGYTLFAIFFSGFVYFAPNLLGHADNYIPANPLVTPPHIQPEWYFLFAYTVLRSIPNKLIGVIALFASLLVLLVLPHVHTCKIRSHQFRPIAKIFY
jgi:quinol-cytochrome oxidoreductase complex cytochrome b subunit